jgi:hypothetical protein
MGDQVYVDENEDIIGEVDKYLITSADIGLDDLGTLVTGMGGILIPAHVDRPAFSMTSQLGLVVPGPWAALEVTRMPETGDMGACATQSPRAVDTLGYPLITSSDAHYVEHIGRRAFDLDFAGDSPTRANGAADLDAIKRALGRRPK